MLWKKKILTYSFYEKIKTTAKTFIGENADNAVSFYHPYLSLSVVSALSNQLFTRTGY